MIIHNTWFNINTFSSIFRRLVRGWQCEKDKCDVCMCVKWITPIVFSRNGTGCFAVPSGSFNGSDKVEYEQDDFQKSIKSPFTVCKKQQNISLSFERSVRGWHFKISSKEKGFAFLFVKVSIKQSNTKHSVSEDHASPELFPNKDTNKVLNQFISLEVKADPTVGDYDLKIKKDKKHAD